MSLIYRDRDQAARHLLADEVGSHELQEQPFVRRQQIQRALKGEGRFKVREATFEYVTFFRPGDDISDENPDIHQFVRNVKKFRFFSMDTESKDPPIFLQLGDFLGNVVMFSDVNLVPPSVKEILEDPRYKFIQSNVIEDIRLLEIHGGIQALGWVDSQVVLHSFVDPKSTTPGRVGQAEEVGAQGRPFKWRSMNFHREEPTDAALFHAMQDVRVPILSVFKAAELHADSLTPPLGPNDNMFPLIWSVINRVLSVPQYLVVHKWFKNRPIEQQWKIAEENHFAPAPYQLNDKQELETIAASDWDYVEGHKLKMCRAEKMSMRSEEGRKRQNKIASAKQRMRKKAAKAAEAAK